MKRSRSAWRVVVGVVALVASVAVQPLAAGGVAVAASANWQVPLGALAHIATLPDGSVAALTLAQGVTHITASGSIDWTKADTLVDQGPTADQNGNVYWSSDQCSLNCSSLISVSESGSPRWTTALPFVADTPIKDGPDGLIYFTGFDGTARLVAVSKTDGHILFTSGLDTRTLQEGVFPFAGGVAVVTEFVTFYSTTGAVLGRYPLGAGVLASGGGSPSGVVFVTRRDCGQNGVTNLAAYTSGGQLWQKPISTVACAPGVAQPYLAALPDGGVVVREAAEGIFGSTTVFNPDGSQRWQSPVPVPAGGFRVEYNRLDPVIDTNGTIAVPDMFTFPCRNNNDRCWGVQIAFFGAAAGKATPAPVLLQIGDPAPESFGNPLTSVAVAPGEVYASLGHVDSSGSPSTPLIAKSVAGLGAPSQSLTLGPVSQTSIPFSGAKVTAQLVDTATGSPVPNVGISFRVTAGPDVGQVGTCVSSGCKTDALGHVLFTLRGGGIGDDTIQGFVDTNSNGSPDPGEPQANTVIHWALPTGRPPARPYVSMGDSFSAGEGVPPYVGVTNKDGCHRSQRSYSELLAKEIVANVKPAYVACSGALVRNLYFGQNGEPPQLDALKPETKLVTITIGGNDAGFPIILDHCVNRGSGEDSSCQAFGNAFIDNALHQLQYGYDFCPPGEPSTACVHFPSLHEVYGRIHTGALNAAIYVLNYPSMFSLTAGGDCPVGPQGTPAKVRERATVTKANQIWIAQQATRLDDLIASEISKAHDQKVPVALVDVTTSFKGHELCGSANASWFNAVVAKPIKTFPFFEVDHGSFHPNSQGQSHMEQVLLSSPGVRT